MKKRKKPKNTNSEYFMINTTTVLHHGIFQVISPQDI